jgi:hypothetical protein
VAIGIGEIPGVTAPECILGRLEDLGTGRDRFVEHSIHLLAGARAIGQGNAIEAAAVVRHLGILGQEITRVECEDHAADLEEDDLLMVVAAPPSQTVLIEAP